MEGPRRFSLILLVLFFGSITACRKDAIEPSEPEFEVEEKDTVTLGLNEDFLGDWYLYSELFHRYNGFSKSYDSIIIYNTQNLGLRFTDSLLYTEKPFSYYRCIENLHGGSTPAEWKGTTNVANIRHDAENTSAHFLSFLNYFDTKDHEELQFIEASSNAEEKYYLLGKVPDAVEADSVTYFLQFYSHTGPLEGLIIRYMGNEGTYETDTLVNGQWTWTKTVKQTASDKIYALEMYGATDAYSDELTEDVNCEFDLFMKYRPFSRSPAQYELHDIVECTVTTSGDFSSESSLGLDGYLRYFEGYVE